MKITGLQCSDCQSEDVLAVWPGREGMQCDLFWLTPNRPLRAWCEPCWLHRFGRLKHLRLPRRGSRLKSAAITNI